MSCLLKIDRCYINSVLTKGAFHRVMSNKWAQTYLIVNLVYRSRRFYTIAVVSQKELTFFFGAVFIRFSLLFIRFSYFSFQFNFNDVPIFYIFRNNVHTMSYIHCTCTNDPISYNHVLNCSMCIYM